MLKKDSFRWLLDIEMNSNLWEYNIDNTYLWPLMRPEIFWSIISYNKGYLQPHAGGKLFKLFNFVFLREFMKTYKFFRFNNRNYNSIFFTTEALHVRDEKTKKFYDRLYSPYYKLFKSQLIFSNSFRFQVSRPSEYEKNLFLADYINIMASIKSHFFKSNIQKDDISNFCQEIQKIFSSSLSNKLSTSLYGDLSKIQYYKSYIDNIITRMDGNIVFIHCASYLGITGEITRRFKEYGIKTIEVQHGYVGPEDYAYNYPESNKAQIIKQYLPDYFLTFGQYWGEQIRTPSRVVPVGNPTLNNFINVSQKETFIKPKTILVVSQGTVTYKMVRITKYLSQKLPNYTIIFKLHPGEVPFTYRYEDLMKYSNVQIKTYDNIYSLIATSEIIVGYNSTTLFESVAFSGKRIFILNNDFIPDSLGYKFSSCQELCDAILDGESGYPSAPPSYFWEPNWEEKISSFLNRLSL
mgnify:CR=1 FL=1